MDYPLKILIDDGDGGFIVAILQKTIIDHPDDEPVLVYKRTEYYHDIKTALRDEF